MFSIFSKSIFFLLLCSSQVFGAFNATFSNGVKSLSTQEGSVQITAVLLKTEMAIKEELLIEATVELGQGPKTSLSCDLVPISYLGRAIDPSQISMNFVLLPPIIMSSGGPLTTGQLSKTRLIKAIVPANIGGAGYRLMCAVQAGGATANITFASLKLTSQGR